MHLVIYFWRKVLLDNLVWLKTYYIAQAWPKTHHCFYPSLLSGISRTCLSCLAPFYTCLLKFYSKTEHSLLHLWWDVLSLSLAPGRKIKLQAFGSLRVSLVLNEIPPGQAPRVSEWAWLSETSGLNQKCEMCSAILSLLGEDKGWRQSYSPMAVTIPTQRNFHKKICKDRLSSWCEFDSWNPP